MRLYSQEDFEQRAAFTEPEVLRTNLAALLLRLAADGLGQAEDFPFIDAPDSRALNDGYRLLQELQALDDERRITRRGRAMARLPLDPRLSQGAAREQALSCGERIAGDRLRLERARCAHAARIRRRAPVFEDSEVGILRAAEAVARLPRGARGTPARVAPLVQGAPFVGAAAVRMG